MHHLCLRFSVSLISVFILGHSYAQAPAGINYQAALRDSETGEALKNEMVFMIISIREGGPNGELVYSETHSGILTSEFGLINLMMGGGDVNEGDFSLIPWSSGDIWYEIEVDSGEGLQSLGSAQFLSVPYALYAGAAENSVAEDPTNELIDFAVFDSETQSIIIQEGDNLVSIPLTGLNVEDGDADPANEIQDLDLDGNELTITNNDGATAIDLSTYLDNTDSQDLMLTGSELSLSGDGSPVDLSTLPGIGDDADADPSNELIVSGSYDPLSNSVGLLQADGSLVQISLEELSVEDADADSTNEVISSVQLFGTTLSITEGSNIPFSVNLDALIDDGDWESDGAGSIFNESDRVGVGTSSPAARLEVFEPAPSEQAISIVSGSQKLIHAGNEMLGLGTGTPRSRAEFGGSVGYAFSVLNGSEVTEYNAGMDDHVLVVNFDSDEIDQFGIFLPPADVCAGRVYIIRKTGAFAAAGQINIDTGVFPIDFSSPDLIIDGNFEGHSATLLSLGNDGWTLLR